MEQPLQQADHIAVIGVDFVQQQHFILHAQQAQGLVAKRHYRHQQLIEGADADFCQQRLFARVGVPGVALAGGGGLIAGIPFGGLRHRLPDRVAKRIRHFPGAVRQHQRRRGVRDKKLAVGFLQALVHRVGGRHARQSDVQPFAFSRRQQPVGQDQRRLGFTGTGDVLHYDKLRAERADIQRRRLLLQRR
ncbi:hypothetical protein [uncultured Pluralibacter sp.]|uniref:hypothetical protein n=1 Tax=uncultured Pluralibacter sp. TaxID=1490864 RepID=UPI00260F9666|nr:hypothetical protein [uncultured Pluralibacter sp.]